MKLTLGKIEQYRLLFNQPLLHKQSYIHYKDVGIVTVQDESGRTFSGEIGPFKGVHSENLEQALRGLSGDFWYLDSYENWNWSSAAFGQINSVMLPSLASCWEQILFKKFLADSNIKKSGEIALTGLLTLNNRNYLEHLNHLLKSGFNSIKIKVGREELQTELEKLTDVCSRLNKNVSIRLDANQSMSTNALDQVWSIVSDYCEYLEEPLSNFEENSKINYPVAFDESLWTLESSVPDHAFVIVKPMLLGLSRIYQLLESGVSKEKVVLSSCFDSGVSTRIYLDFVIYHDLLASHGFGPYNFIVQDVLENPLDLRNGRVMWSIT